MNQTALSFTAEQIYHYPFHHRPSLRLFYVLEGSLEIRNVSGNTTLRSGDMEFVNIEEPAEILALREGNVVLVMEIGSSFLKSINANVDKLILNVGACQFFKLEERHRTKQNQNNIARLKDMMLGLLDEYLGNRFSSSLEKNLQVFCQFIIEHFDDIKKLVSCFPNANDRMIERFQRIDLYMQSHLSEKVKLDYLVEKEYLTIQYLSSEIKNKYHRTFSSILEYYRVTAATRLILADDNIFIADIVDRCGFSDDKYFYRAFKNHLGCTPSVFRRKVKEQGSPVIRYLDLSSKDFMEIRSEAVKSEGEKNGNDFERKNERRIDPVSNSDLAPDNIGSLTRQRAGYYTGKMVELGFLKGHSSRFTAEFTGELALEDDEIWCCHRGDRVTLLVREPNKTTGGDRILLSADLADASSVSTIYLKKGSRIRISFGKITDGKTMENQDSVSYGSDNNSSGSRREQYIDLSQLRKNL